MLRCKHQFATQSKTMQRIVVFLLICALAPVSFASAPPVDPELKALLKQAANEADGFTDRFDAWVWLADMSGRLERKIPDANFRIDLLKNVHREATRTNLKPELVLAVIQVESNFDPFAISSAGARGLMQIMPFWLNEIGRPNDNLFQPNTNLRFGCTILRYYLDKENGNRIRALARYNGSLGRRDYPARVFHLWNTRWFPQ